MRQGRRQPERFCAQRHAAGGPWLRVILVAAILSLSSLTAGGSRAADDAASGSAAVSPWATGGASATAKAGDTDGKPASTRLAQVPVSQAYPLPATVIQGNAIPPGWAPQAVPYQAIGPDGRPITMYYAPTYVFTYPIGPPVPMTQAVPRGASQVNRRQAYGQPGAYGQGWNYQSQGARPATYVPPPTVVRYPPVPFQYPPGSPALAGTPLAPPQPQLPFSAPAVPQAMVQGPLQPQPAQWVSSAPDMPPPPGVGSGQAFAAAAPAAMAGAVAAIAPPAASSPSASSFGLVPVQPVSSQPPGLRPIGGQSADPVSSGGLPPSGRSANSHLWRVVGVHDGDTVTCLDDANQQQKVRLAEIDAPELGQDFGKVSRDALAEMVFGKTVEVVDEGKDRYGRWIGHLIVNGEDANRQMVATGNAWHYAAYSQDASLATLQEQAQIGKLGLWSQPNPTPPWDFRKNGKL